MPIRFRHCDLIRAGSIWSAMTEEQVVNVRGEDGNSSGDHGGIKANGVPRGVGGDLDLAADSSGAASEELLVPAVEKNCKDAVVSNGAVEEGSDTAAVVVVSRESELKCVDSENGAGSVQKGVVESEIRDESTNAAAEELVTDHEEYVVVGASDVQNGVAADGENCGDANANVNGVEECKILDRAEASGDENSVVVTVVEGDADVSQSDREFECVDVHSDVAVDRAEEVVTAATDENAEDDAHGRSESISDKDVDKSGEIKNVVGADVSDGKEVITNGNHDVEDVAENNVVPVDVNSVSATTDMKTRESEDSQKSLQKEQVESISGDAEQEPEPSECTKENVIVVEGQPGSKLEKSEEAGTELVPEAENLAALNSTDVIGDGDVVSDIAVDSKVEPSVNVHERKNNVADSGGERGVDVHEMQNGAVDSEAEPSNSVVQTESEPPVVSKMKNNIEESAAEPSNGAVETEDKPSNGATESEAEPSNSAVESEVESSKGAVESETEPSNGAVEGEAELSNSEVEGETEPSNGAVESKAEPSNSAVESEAEPPSNGAVEREAKPSNGAVEREARPSNGAVQREAEPSNGAVERQAEPSDGAVEREAEPSNGAVEREAEPSNSVVKREDEPSNGALESEAEPSHGEVESEVKPSHGVVESEPEPSNGVVESEAEPSNGAGESETVPSNGAVESEAVPSNGAEESEVEPSNGVVECEAEPSNGVVEREAEPSNGIVGREAEPSNGAVESEAEPSSGIVEGEAKSLNGVVESESEPSVDVCEMKSNAVNSEVEPSSSALQRESESSVVSEMKNNVVESEADHLKGAVESEVQPAVDLSEKKTDAVETEAEPSVESGHSVEGAGSKQDEDSRQALDTLDGQNVGSEVVKKPFYYLIRIPRYDDDENIKEQIKNALHQVEEKTKIRDAIRAESQTIKASYKDFDLEFKAAIAAHRAARDLLKSKRQEMDSVQSTMNRLNNAISVGDIDDKIRNMEHMIQHETLPLNEEKQLIRQIKQLKQNREELSSNMRKQDQSQQSVDHKDDNIEDHFKHLQLLKKEMEVLRNNVLKSDSATKAAKKKYSDEYDKLNEVQARFKAADDIRQEAYAKLLTLKKQLHEKSKNFWEYRNAANKAQELAAGGKKEELQCFCVDQVESIMELWNNNDEFRRDYIRCNTRSTLRRLQTLDGRSLGPDEEPPIIPNAITERTSKNISMVPQSTLEQEKKSTPTESVSIKKDEPILKVVVQRTEATQTTKAKNPTKPAPLEKSVARWGDESDEDEDKKEEMILKAEKARKEIEEAMLKEKRRLEEIEKAKEALQRKKRNAEKAQQRAALKAQKEAEQKEKEREKRARKKERRKAASAVTVENAEQESAPTSETLTRSIEEFDENEKSVDVTKKPQKPSQFTRQTKAKAVPLALRNRGKRRIQPWMWLLIAVMVVVALFYLGNISSLRSSLESFGY
ncbi:hypothetical protein VNO78_09818 [Psophocarpus tetragonolobus]|uniref:Proton pump-interactor 1 n=1 Tax=Psophocarpus tetragonolobus TaxID=3891 RepID=A0AAN9SYT8_PSOTE